MFNLSFITINNFFCFSLSITVAFALYEWFKIAYFNIAKFNLNASEITKIGNMMNISAMIKEGSMAYLLRQLKILSIVALCVFAFLFYFTNVFLSLAFLIGASLSWVCSFIAMYASVSSNYKVTLLSKFGIAKAFNAAFSVGKFVGYLIKAAAFGLIYFVVYLSSCCGDNEFLINILIGLSFGASLITIFARVAGGIFTKGADIGADLVGKIEQNIPEDDFRNPAVIADNVGDNVGDCAGMAADLFESYIVIASSAISLCLFLFNAEGLNYVYLILAILASGSLSSILTLQTGWNIKKYFGFSTLQIALKTGFLASVVLFNVFGIFNTSFNIPNLFNLYLCALVGLFSASLIMPLTEYYTSSDFSPVKSITAATSKGAASAIIQGISIGFKSTLIPFTIIGLSILQCLYLAGIAGVGIACVAMISVCAVILSLDAFGPITDNAGGLAQMANLEDSFREVTDELDSLGNITKATTKGYAVYSAALASIVLMAMFKIDLANSFKDFVWNMDISNGNVIAGMLIGSAVAATFAALCMIAVNKASMAIIEEVRYQFRTMPGIMEGTTRPLYARAVDILTKASLKEMILPGILPIFSLISLFLLVYFLSGIENAFISLGGFATGFTITGIFIAYFMTIAGGAWDNAKKAIEASGLKGSEEHKAAVIGDTIGDPFKDTAGPAINPVIKLVGIISLILIILFK